LALAISVGVVFGLAVAAAAIPDAASDDSRIQVEPARADRGRDWPMLGGTFERNMVNTRERNIPADWKVDWKIVNGERVVDPEHSTNIKWAVPLGSRTYGGPVVASDRVFVGTNNEVPRDPTIRGDRGILMCFRAANGAFLWQAVHNKLPSGQVNDWPKEGICSTPAIDGNRVCYVSNRCELVCADLGGLPNKPEAKVLWRFDMIKELGVFPHNMSNCSPAVVGSLVFVGTSNGVSEEHIQMPAPAAPSFVAVNKLTGKPVWSSNAPGKDVMHAQWSSPACTDTQVIFPGGDGWLRSFERTTGKPLWKFDANPKDSKYELGGRGSRSDFIAAPVVVGNRCYIGTGRDPEHFEGVGHLWCIDITGSGDLSPELVTDASTDPPKTRPNPNSAVVWHYGGPVTPQDHERGNRDYYFGRTMSTVAVHDGLVYAAELAGYLHCLDARTGKVYWIHDIKAAVWGSPYWVDGKVYVCTEDGDVWIFDHGRDSTPPRRIEMDQPIRTTPVAANGVLYIATESYLYAIQKR
jgi:outer membrane protein assembly factor BamB